MQLVYLCFWSWLWLAIIAAAVSLIWYYAFKIRTAGGYWLQAIVAWIGAWLGTPVLGNWKFWVLKGGNVCLIPAVLGSIAAVMLCVGKAKLLADIFKKGE